MLKKLRWKVTLVTTGVIGVVLGLLVIGINGMNWMVSVRGADELLEMIAENRGRMPAYAEMEPRRPDVWDDGITEETPYDTRFFVVWVDEEMQMMDTQMEFIASVTGEEAGTYLERAVKSGRTSGYVKNYRFYRARDGAHTFYVFLDSSRQFRDARNLLLVSLLVFAAAMCVTFLLAYLLSPKAIAPLLKNVERQKQFITNAGHEIKTPLSVITACTEVLAMDLPENEWVEDIRSEAGRMKELVNDLVTLSRWEEGNPALERRGFSMSQAVLKSAEPFQALCRAGNRELDLGIQEGVTYWGNEEAVRKLVCILLDNSVKYSEEGSTIHLGLEGRRQAAVLIVKNQCVPGADIDVDRLFERFYRGEPSRNREKGGSGIGLSIARAIVEAHGGRIRASVKENTICFQAEFTNHSQKILS